MGRITRKTVKLSGLERRMTPVPAIAAVVVLQGSPTDVGVHRVIDRPCTIGRGPGVDLALLGDGMSRRHCVLVPNRSGVILQDLGSTNGTGLNGERLPGPVQLTDGDLIYMGDTVLKYTARGGPELRYAARMDERIGTDDLTGLMARHRFEGDLTRALEESAVARVPVGAMMLDLDGIKIINDTHGHLVGAHVIGETGRIIGQVIHLYGAASRLSGDEFACFLPRQTKAVTVDLARLIVRLVEQHHYEKDGIVVRPTISVGVAAFPEDAQEARDLLSRADEALYRAKQSGRNTVAI